MTRGNERRILDQCAPALTGVKTGSLLKVDMVQALKQTPKSIGEIMGYCETLKDSITA